MLNREERRRHPCVCATSIMCRLRTSRCSSSGECWGMKQTPEFSKHCLCVDCQCPSPLLPVLSPASCQPSCSFEADPNPIPPHFLLWSNPQAPHRRACTDQFNTNSKCASRARHRRTNRALGPRCAPWTPCSLSDDRRRQMIAPW